MPVRLMHANKHRDKLLARVRRLCGQIEAIERSIESEASCGSVMYQIGGARGAMAGLMAEVVEDHISRHLIDGARFSRSARPRRCR